MNALLLDLAMTIAITTGNVALPVQHDACEVKSPTVCQNRIDQPRSGVIYGVDVNSPLMDQIRRTA